MIFFFNNWSYFIHTLEQLDFIHTLEQLYFIHILEQLYFSSTVAGLRFYVWKYHIEISEKVSNG